MADQARVVESRESLSPNRFAPSAQPTGDRVGRDSASPLKPPPRPGWLPESAWPFETRALELNGSTIAVTDVGRGPVLLLVHTGTWSIVWRDLIERLAASFRCVAIDAPGTGQSSRVPASALTLRNSARAVSATIDALKLDDLTLVFHDLGGPAGIAAAARSPERVRGIVAINSFGWRPSGALFRAMLAIMGSAPMREFDAMTGFLPRITASAFGVGRHLDPQSRDAFKAGMNVRAFHGYMRDVRSCDDLHAEVASALAGPFRELPLLTIFGGRNDPLGFQPRWKAMYKNARQVIVPKGNHFPMCDAPGLVADTIRDWHREMVAPASG